MMLKPAHKRAAGSQGESSSQHAPKKTRFVEPSDDPVNFAEEVDSQLENPSARRKGRVNTAGYESDSSDDGEGVVLSRRPQAAGAEDEDEDMFAMGEKEEKEKVEDTGGKKKQEFMRLGDIEGQEFGKEGSGDEEEEEEPEDEDDAERRKKAGMGYELSSFNMREEMEEGKFASDGTYVKTFDPHAVHDKWMDGMDDKEIKRARRQHRHQEKLQKEMMMAEEKELQELGGRENIEMKLLSMLKKGETVVEALHRLGVKAKKTAPVKKKPNRRPKDAGDTMVMDRDKDEAVKPKTDIDEITHFASMLMSFGDTDIYNKTYEEFVRSVRASGKVNQSWVPPSADVRYEYRWDVPGTTPGQEGQVFGPYSEDEMQSWYKAAYFGTTGEKIKIRTVGSSDWGGWDDIVT